MTRLVILLVLVGCGDNAVPPDASDLPTCVSLGCTTPPESIDKICAQTGECYCQLSRDAPRIRCTK